MRKIPESLHMMIERLLKDTFLVIDSSQGFLIFKSKIHRDSQYTLFVNHLDDEHVFQVAEMLQEVYFNIEVPNSPSYMNTTVTRIPLNKANVTSSKFVKMVLGLDKSYMHKLFLLASGNTLMSDSKADLIFAMAANKDDVGDSPSRLFGTSKSVFDGMNAYYILPTVTVKTFMNHSTPYKFYSWDRNSVETTSRLLAFLGYRNSKTTFAEYRKLNFSEAVKTDRGIDSFELLNNVQTILISGEYSALAESMTAAEMIALSKIIPNSGVDLKLPKDFLRNRARAIVGQPVITHSAYASIRWFLSDAEVESLDSNNGVELINKELLGDEYTDTPPFIYAAIAEVLVAMGLSKALEVIKEINPAKCTRDTKPEAYEATTALILEALNHENSDVPFGWAAQMSEHAWVINQSREDDKSVFKV